MKRKTNILLIVIILLLSSCTKKSEEFEKLEESKIRNIADLSILKVYNHNVVSSKKGPGKGLKSIFKKTAKLWVEFDGYVQIGIDTQKVKIEVNKENVSITMPNAEIQGEANIDSDTLKKESFIIQDDSPFFNKNKFTPEDEKKIYEDAKLEILKSIKSNKSLFKLAEERAKKLIENYIKVIGKENNIDYKITWRN